MVRAAWEEESPLKLYVAIPAKGLVDMTWSLGFGQILRQSPVGYITESNSVPAVDYARNELVEKFLQSPCEWMLWLDTDVLPPPDCIARLLDKRQYIVSGLYRSRNLAFATSQGGWPIVAGYFDKNGNVQELVAWNPGEVVQVDAVGMGCVLMHRKVLEAIAPPWFEFSIKYKWRPDVGKDAYEREPKVSEDWYFFHKVKKAGFKVWLDTTVVCSHQTTAFIGYDGKIYGGGLR